MQSSSLLQIAKTLRVLAKKNSLKPLKTKNEKTQLVNIISKEFITPLEEARLAVEEIVIPKNTVVDLFPRTSLIRNQQHDLISHYQIIAKSVGKNKNRRLRLYPPSH